jgi:hypothetical protein
MKGGLSQHTDDAASLQPAMCCCCRSISYEQHSAQGSPMARGPCTIDVGADRRRREPSAATIPCAPPGMIPPWKSQGTDGPPSRKGGHCCSRRLAGGDDAHCVFVSAASVRRTRGSSCTIYLQGPYAFSCQDIKDATVHYRSDNHNHYHAMPLSAWFRLPVDVRLPNPGRTRMRQIKDEHFSRLRWLPAGEDAHIWIQFSIARGAISILKARPQLHRLEVSLVIV